MNDKNRLRRRFLQFLASSPALYCNPYTLSQTLTGPYAPETVSRAGDAINVFDFHETAKRSLMPGHYTYMALGTDDGGTLSANREGFKRFQLRMRRLVDVSNIDTSIELFGRKYPMPIILAPCGSNKAFHPEGELAVARAAKTKNVEQILSTVTSTGVEEVNEARGRPVWYQLYPSREWAVTEALVKRAELSGCPVVALTVDLPASNREILDRHRRATNPDCQVCHSPQANVIPQKPMYQNIRLSGSRSPDGSFMDWDFVDKLRDSTSMKLLLKGIVTAEDAALAVDHGVEGIIVSNHGGRAEDSGRGTIECLPEIVRSVNKRIPIIIDSGFRRGTDIFKALALGADAIAIGRPYLWGLGSFGQEGVEAVLNILQKELEIVMKQARTIHVGTVDQRFIA